MAPLISETKDLQFTLNSGNVKLRYKEFTAKTNGDFVATEAPLNGGRRDVGSFFSGSGGGISADVFYVGAATIEDFQLGDSLFVQQGRGQKVVVVHTI